MEYLINEILSICSLKLFTLICQYINYNEVWFNLIDLIIKSDNSHVSKLLSLFNINLYQIPNK